MAIDNGRHGMLHNNSNKGNTTTNERKGVFHDNSDKGNASIMQYFEDIEEMEMSNNSVTNGSNSDNLFENNSSQESICSEK